MEILKQNPGPAQIEKMQTIDQYNKEKNRTDDDLKFWYMNCRSLNNKYEKLSNFLTTLDELSSLVVTETCIKENNTIPDSFLCSSHHSIHQPRSSSTELERGGGVGIWRPKQFSIKIRSDLNTTNQSFFESLGIAVTEPLKEKLLINVAYCSNVNLSKFFLDEMTSEISNVYSSPDNLSLFGDYNLNIPKETGKQLLNNFIADNGLQYLNTKKATRTNGENFSLIDQCFISKNQIFETDIIESILENDHFTIVNQSSLNLEWKQQKTEYLMRDKRRYTRSKFNRDIALQDWSLIYKNIGANGVFHKFIEIFQNVLNIHAPLEKIEVKTKKEHKKGCQKNCVVSLMKNIVFSMNGKKILNKSLTVTKYLETIENYVEHLTITQNNFSRISQFQKNNGNSSRTKLFQINRQEKFQS